MDEARLTQELAPFCQILNIGIMPGEVENKVTLVMARANEAAQAADFLQRAYGLNVGMEAPDAGATATSGKMREIWIGNLAQTVTKEKLYKHFFIYGDIESIDMFMFKNFAFVRFKEVAAAIRATELAKTIRIENRLVKISFADPVRRKEALGDMPGYTFGEHNAKALILKYVNSTMALPEENLRAVLSRYGNVKAILVLESVMQQDHPQAYKPHIFVDYNSHVSICTI